MSIPLLNSDTTDDAFATLANYIPQFVWMCTPDGLNFYFNQRWVNYTGMSLEKSYGTGWNTPFHPDDKQIAWDAWSHAVKTGGTYRVESRLRAADGSYRSFLIQGEPLTNELGTVDRWFGTCTDIEDLKQAEQALLQSEKLAAVGRLSASIAHEINNPLEAVMNTLYLAQSVPNLPEEVGKYLSMADDELKRIAHITRQTLGFYRESSAPQPVIVNAVLDSAVDLLSGKIQSARIKVVKQYRGEYCINAIPGELRQVFANLIANAIEADKNGGTLKLRLSRWKSLNVDRDWICVTIADEA
jgi:PAS domain S-box-containing protein